MKQDDLHKWGCVSQGVSHTDFGQETTKWTVYRTVTGWQANPEKVMLEEKFYVIFKWREYKKDGTTVWKEKLSRRFQSLGLAEAWVEIEQARL